MKAARLLPRSLQGRLLALVLGLVAAVWVATAALIWVDVRHELDELLDGHLAQAAALLVAQQARGAEGEGEGEADERDIDAPALHPYAPRVAFQVFHEGRLALRSANAPAWPMAGPAEPGLQTVRIDGVAWRVFTAVGAERDVRVQVGEQLGSRDSILWAVLRSALWPTLLTLPLLALVLWWAVRQSLTPLRRLGRLLAARQPQALEPLALAAAPSEMAPMLAALNGLFGRIGALIESERRFTADAAHELRTPIAAIRAQAQVALAEADDALRRHALASTLAGCDRAARLVEQLLTLSRLEAGAAPTRSAVDLAALARSVVAELAPRAIQRRQEIGFEGASDGNATFSATVDGDATLLAVLVRNLVDNAIRYAGPGARVRVSVSRPTKAPAGAGLRLTVEDDGAGMVEADMQRLGERFFRVLGSGQEGSGLGASIVRRIAEAHGARVQVGRSAALGGLAVSVEWPAGSPGA